MHYEWCAHRWGAYPGHRKNGRSWAFYVAICIMYLHCYLPSCVQLHICVYIYSKFGVCYVHTAASVCVRVHVCSRRVPGSPLCQGPDQCQRNMAWWAGRAWWTLCPPGGRGSRLPRSLGHPSQAGKIPEEPPSRVLHGRTRDGSWPYRSGDH